MIDYAVLPPEVNSARMYAGAGSAPMLAAAAGWDRLAAVLASTEQSYRAVLTELTDGSWQGNSASAMSAAAEPYLAWMNTTAAQAAQTANQARATAAAYEAAFAATVPPSVIAANRAALATLLTTNVFGQNTAAIAANQADYSEMWAQDAAAMHTYAANTAAAAPDLNTFTAAPQTTNPAAAGSQTNTAALASTTLDNILNNNNPILSFLNSDPVQAFETIFPVLDPFWEVVTIDSGGPLSFTGLDVLIGVIPAIFAGQAFLGATGAMPVFAGSSVSEGAQRFTLVGSQAPALEAPGATGPGATGLGGGGISAGLGRATQIGGLSAPPAWSAAAPRAVRLATAATSMADSPGSGMAAPGGWLGGTPLMSGMVNAPRTGAPDVVRPESSSRVIPRLAREGCDHEGIRHGSAQPPSSAEDGAAELNERELRQLEELRQAVAELTERRDAAARSIREAIR